MKTSLKRFLSALLAVCICLSMLPNVMHGVKAATSVSFSEMLARAEAIVNYKWTPSQRIYTWNGSTYGGKSYFEAGQTVIGMPYTLFSWELGVDSLLSLSQYQGKVSSNYSTTKYCNSVGANRTGPVYGSCCATFVSEVFGGDYMNGANPRFDSVYAIEHNSSYGKTYYNVTAGNIQPGDALSNSTSSKGGGHIVWVGEVTNTTITIYEQTPPVAKKTVVSKSSVNASGYLLHGGSVYSTVTRNNQLSVNSNYTPGKSQITGMQKTYLSGSNITFRWTSTENTTHYNLTLDKLVDNKYVRHDVIFYANSGHTMLLSDGIYRAVVTSTNSNVWTEDGSTWAFTDSDWVYFVVGEHVHNKGEYVFYEAVHPHYSCYKCSFCGEIWRDSSSPNIQDSCLECQRPGKPVLTEMQKTYLSRDSVTFGWTATENTTHYNFWLYTKNAQDEWEPYEHTFYVTSGFGRTLPVGEYRCLIQSYNSNYRWEDGSDWLYTESDFFYFTVCQSEYIVAYNANGGSGAPSSQTKYYNTTLLLDSDRPARSGYTFLGWATDSSATVPAYQPGDGFTNNSDTILYAVWKRGCEGNSHSYSYAVTQNPTTSTTGTLKGSCSKCSGTTTVTLPKLTTTDYTYKVTKAATCTANGIGRYTWKTTAYGSFYFDVTIPKTGHSYTHKVTAPTCTAQGYTTHTCTCGDSYKDTYTASTGHSYSYAVTQNPTTSTTGTLKGSCSKCSGTTTVTLPKLTTTDYTYKVTKAATCTASGTGRYTWKTTAYGSFYFDVTIPKTGHSYTHKVTGPTCTEEGYTAYTCSVCGDSYIGNRVAATGHKYEQMVVRPTCTETGYTTHTCACGYSYTDSYTNAVSHSYGYTVAAQPTESAAGLLVGACVHCGKAVTVVLPQLNSADYTYTVISEPTETTVGTGRYTWNTTTYGNFSFEVTLAARTALIITKQPVNASAYNGKTAKVTVGVQGDGLTYKWYYANKGSDKFTYTSSFKGATYSVSMTAARNGRRVYCVITDRYGNSVRTNTVTLTKRTWMKITKQPVSVSAYNGKTAKVTVGVQGDGLTYKWYYANKGSDKFTYTSAFKGATYSVSMTAARSGRRIYCVITDKYGRSVKTDVVTLTRRTWLKITKQPVSVTVAKGGMAKVTVGVQGDGLTYQWFYADAGSNKFVRTTKFTTKSYYVEMNNDRAGRRVYCVITDKYGRSVRTNTVTLGMK